MRSYKLGFRLESLSSICTLKWVWWLLSASVVFMPSQHSLPYLVLWHKPQVYHVCFLFLIPWETIHSDREVISLWDQATSLPRATVLWDTSVLSTCRLSCVLFFRSVSYYALSCLGVRYCKPTALVLASAWQASTLPLGYIYLKFFPFFFFFKIFFIFETRFLCLALTVLEIAL